MKLAPLTRYRIRVVLIVTVAWVLAGILIELNNALVFDPVTDEAKLYFPFGQNIWQHLLITAIGPFVGGLTGGTLIVFVLRGMLRRRSFGRKLLIQSVILLVLIVMAIMLVGAVQAMTTDGAFWPSFVEAFVTWRVFRLIITWFVVVMITILMIDVAEKYGQRVLWKIITGRYHRPVNEERIFMFMDISDSTQIAEQLGDQKYFQLLRSVFSLATEAVLNAEGDIYQYVGDELILTWEVENGLRNANCVRCFFAVMDAIASHRDLLMSGYGVVPGFKAGIHMGEVVAGEIGMVKKDIVYAGDVLNSTSRIMSLTRQYGVRILASDAIYENLKQSDLCTFQFVDSVILRGKSQSTKLYSVSINEQHVRTDVK